MLEEKYKPLYDLKRPEEKEKQKTIFLKGTDAREGARVNGEIDQFIDKFLEVIKAKVHASKTKLIADKIKEYKKINSRQDIQMRIDTRIFNRANKNEDSVFEYLTEPKKVI